MFSFAGNNAFWLLNPFFSMHFIFKIYESIFSPSYWLNSTIDRVHCQSKENNTLNTKLCRKQRDITPLSFPKIHDNSLILKRERSRGNRHTSRSWMDMGLKKISMFSKRVLVSQIFLESLCHSLIFSVGLNSKKKFFFQFFLKVIKANFLIDNIINPTLLYKVSQLEQ